MTIRTPVDAQIQEAFKGTNFGKPYETLDKKKFLVARAVVKKACGFHSGHTLETICREVGLFTAKGTPRKWAKKWAYCEMFRDNLMPPEGPKK
jgi:hypothetical protein